MGMLIDGVWSDREPPRPPSGAFVRAPSQYAGDIDSPCVAAEPGRFHLIASLSCPWSHRAVIARCLKGLTDLVPLQVAGGERVQGYPVNGGRPWLVPGCGAHIRHLHELYTLGDQGYTGRVTVPVLWDARARRIVSNDSARIMRAFDRVRPPGFTLVPTPLVEGIEALNEPIHRALANGVYRAGLAESQAAYDEAVTGVFALLDDLETRLSMRRYLFGATITEADWRLFATLVRFDAAYHVHFRCARRRLIDYPNLWCYARDLYAWRGIAATVDMDAIRAGYYRNDGRHNPYRIVAVAPAVAWDEPHGRESLGPACIALRNGRTVAVDPATFDPAAW